MFRVFDERVETHRFDFENGEVWHRLNRPLERVYRLLKTKGSCSPGNSKIVTVASMRVIFCAPRRREHHAQIATSPRRHDSTFGQLANDPAHAGAEDRVDGDIVGELCVSGSFTVCHTLPLRLLSFSATKIFGINPAQSSKVGNIDRRLVNKVGGSPFNVTVMFHLSLDLNARELDFYRKLDFQKQSPFSLNQGLPKQK